MKRWCGIAAIVLCAVFFYTRADVQPASGEALGGFAKTLDIRVVRQADELHVKTYHGIVHGSPVNASRMGRYEEVLAPELALYLAEFLKKARVNRVVVCSGLRFEQQQRNAVPDFEHETLYLEGERGMYALEYMRKVIHHELFHLVDYRDDGVLYDDPEWKKLNPPGFSYARGGAAMQDDPYASLPLTARPGFLNGYSTSGVEEDKAEVFAQLMADAAALKERCAKDAVLDRKMQRIKELCAKFCPQMDAAYWVKVEEKQLKNKEGGKH